MTNDKRKTPEQEAAEAGIRESPVFRSGAELPGQTQIGVIEPSIALTEPHTLTSVAYTSAEAFSPDQAELVKEFQEAIDNVDDKTIFALADGTMMPQDYGIATELEKDKWQALSKVEKWERENKQPRDHEIRKAKIEARGPLWPKIAGYVAWAILVVLYLLLAFKDSVQD